MKIGLTAMNQIWESKSVNMIGCNKLAEIAAKNDVDLLIFPEMTLTGFSLATQVVSEDINSSNTLHQFSATAENYNLGVIAGMVLNDHGVYSNCAVAFDRQGEQLSCYAKIHPFSLSGENRYVTGGDELATFEYEGFRFGLTICYDLRFPLLWYALAENCDCIINIANWPARRIDHWKTLLQARAIENQIYVIGINRVGIDGNNLEYSDSSYVFSPDGSMLSSIVVDEGFRIVEIDKAMVIKCQADFPARKDRRVELYKKLLFNEI